MFLQKTAFIRQKESVILFLSLTTIKMIWENFEICKNFSF